MMNLNGNVFLFESFTSLFRDSEKMVCDFAKVDTAFGGNIFHNVKFSFFNNEIFHVALLRMMNLNGNVFLFKSFKPLFRDCENVVCDFARVDVAI